MKRPKTPRGPQKPGKPPQPQAPQTPSDLDNWGGTPFRAYVMRLANYFVDIMFLRGYRATIEYKPKIMDATDAGNREVLAAVRADHAYMTVNIEVAKGLWEKYNQGKLDEVAEVMCHEFCHVVHSGLYGWAEQAVCPTDRSTWVEDKERVTTWVSRVVMSLVPQSVWREESVDNAQSNGSQAKT